MTLEEIKAEIEAKGWELRLSKMWAGQSYHYLYLLVSFSLLDPDYSGGPYITELDAAEAALRQIERGE